MDARFTVATCATELRQCGSKGKERGRNSRGGINGNGVIGGWGLGRHAAVMSNHRVAEALARVMLDDLWMSRALHRGRPEV